MSMRRLAPILALALVSCAHSPRLSPGREITRATYQMALEDDCMPDYLDGSPSPREIRERAQVYIESLGWDIDRKATCGVSETGRDTVWLSPCIDEGDDRAMAHILVHEGVHVCHRSKIGNPELEKRLRIVPGYVNAPNRWWAEMVPRRAEIQIRQIWGMPEDKQGVYAYKRARKFCGREGVYKVGRILDCTKTSIALLMHEVVWGRYAKRGDIPWEANSGN